MSFLASSIFGHEFVNYRKNVTASNRLVFSHNVRHNLPGMIPVVIDSVDQNLSLALSNCDTSMPEKMWKHGKEYTMSINTTVDEVLKEINANIKVIGKKLVLGLEDGSLLQENESLGKIYKKNKNNKDLILYLLLTQETTIYGYILSILRYLGILPTLKSKDKIIIKKDSYDIQEIKDNTDDARINYLYEINQDSDQMKSDILQVKYNNKSDEFKKESLIDTEPESESEAENYSNNYTINYDYDYDSD